MYIICFILYPPVYFWHPIRVNIYNDMNWKILILTLYRHLVYGNIYVVLQVATALVRREHTSYNLYEATIYMLQLVPRILGPTCFQSVLNNLPDISFYLTLYMLWRVVDSFQAELLIVKMHFTNKCWNDQKTMLLQTMHWMSDNNDTHWLNC